MTENPTDILVTNGTVMTMEPGADPIANGAVAITGNLVSAVGPAHRFSKDCPGCIIDAGGGIIMPGLVNTHTHAAMTCFRGLADDLPLMDWLEGHIFPAESRLTHEMVYWGSLLACVEMIQSGTTCFCDMYLFEDAVARAARDAGMRAVVGEVLFDFPSPNYGPLENGWAYSQTLFETWADEPLIQIAVEPHSPYLCAPSLLTRANDLARGNGGLLVIHLSETEQEVARIQECGILT